MEIATLTLPIHTTQGLRVQEMTKRKETLTSEQAVYFRNEFREARYATLQSPEEYQQILFAIERFGAYLTDNHDGTLKDYESRIVRFVNCNDPLHKRMPCTRKDYHAKCGTLFRIMMTERNSALHKGSFVKILISHLIELSIMLEDALMTIMSDEIKNYMTRNPICAYPWQPISFIRQKMLENSGVRPSRRPLIHPCPYGETGQRQEEMVYHF